MGGGDLVALLHCGDMVAVVLHSSFILCSQTDRLQIEWQQQCLQVGIRCTYYDILILLGWCGVWGHEYRWWVDTTGTGRVVSEVSNLMPMLSV